MEFQKLQPFVLQLERLATVREWETLPDLLEGQAENGQVSITPRQWTHQSTFNREWLTRPNGDASSSATQPGYVWFGPVTGAAWSTQRAKSAGQIKSAMEIGAAKFGS